MTLLTGKISLGRQLLTWLENQMKSSPPRREDKWLCSLCSYTFCADLGPLSDLPVLLQVLKFCGKGGLGVIELHLKVPPFLTFILFRWDMVSPGAQVSLRLCLGVILNSWYPCCTSQVLGLQMCVTTCTSQALCASRVWTKSLLSACPLLYWLSYTLSPSFWMVRT